jgi:phosphoglycolate phosphatase-like HAD superfamily hydrolase
MPLENLTNTKNNFPKSVSTSELRVLLWDIDGTLLVSKQNGAYKNYFAPALIKTFGTAGCLNELMVSGMTDLEIAANALKTEGIMLNHIYERLDDWLHHYANEMKREIDEGHSWDVLKGVREILEATKYHPRFINALMTGNIKSAAQLKLEKVGLWNFFELHGAFGEESHDRKDLPSIAANRITQELEMNLHPSQFIVIGDTPNDIACARHFGARSVAVATGRNNSPELLQSHQPDVLLLNLRNTKGVLVALDSL